jgi:hypothetical protein
MLIECLHSFSNASHDDHSKYMISCQISVGFLISSILIQLPVEQVC